MLCQVTQVQADEQWEFVEAPAFRQQGAPTSAPTRGPEHGCRGLKYDPAPRFRGIGTSRLQSLHHLSFCEYDMALGNLGCHPRSSSTSARLRSDPKDGCLRPSHTQIGLAELFIFAELAGNVSGYDASARDQIVAIGNFQRVPRGSVLRAAPSLRTI